jgi:ribosomal subunit interface protein
MKTPLRITFRRLAPTPAITTYVQTRAQKLEQLHRQITALRVAIESPHRHKSHGQHYRVRIDLTVPGADLVVTRSPEAHVANEDLYAALDDAFDRAKRVLVEEVRRRSGKHAAHADRDSSGHRT